MDILNLHMIHNVVHVKKHLVMDVYFVKILMVVVNVQMDINVYNLMNVKDYGVVKQMEIQLNVIMILY